MIRCNSNKCEMWCNRCVVDMDGLQSMGGTICCDIAEDLDFDRVEILRKCKYAEPTSIHDATLKELWS